LGTVVDWRESSFLRNAQINGHIIPPAARIVLGHEVCGIEPAVKSDSHAVRWFNTTCAGISDNVVPSTEALIWGALGNAEPELHESSLLLVHFLKDDLDMKWQSQIGEESERSPQMWLSTLRQDSLAWCDLNEPLDEDEYQLETGHVCTA
jgi:hypothetical protein